MPSTRCPGSGSSLAYYWSLMCIGMHALHSPCHADLAVLTLSWVQVKYKCMSRTQTKFEKYKGDDPGLPAWQDPGGEGAEAAAEDEDKKAEEAGKKEPEAVKKEAEKKEAETKKEAGSQ